MLLKKYTQTKILEVALFMYQVTLLPLGALR